MDLGSGGTVDARPAPQDASTARADSANAEAPDGPTGGGAETGGAEPPLPAGDRGRTVCLNASGPGGPDTYQHIQSLFGALAIDNPDNQHMPPLRHVLEDVDDVVGPHFKMIIHRDIDVDNNRLDRQRVEMSVQPDAADLLKGKDGQAFTYTWRFKLGADLKISARWSIFFQIKSEVGSGNPSAPIVVLVGEGGVNLQIHQIGNDNASHTLAVTPMAPLRDQWLEATVHTVYSHHGAFSMTVKRADGTVALAANVRGADMWRDGPFTRPKWGIYRSLGDKQALNATEDNVRFANIAITPGDTPTDDCRNSK
jgi:hypothetical protein